MSPELILGWPMGAWGPGDSRQCWNPRCRWGAAEALRPGWELTTGLPGQWGWEATS